MLELSYNSVYNRLISYRCKYGGIRVKKRMNLKNMVIIILIAILVISYVRQELTMNKIHKDIEAKQTQLNELQDKNKKLQDEVNQSSTDEYIERMVWLRMARRLLLTQIHLKTSKIILKQRTIRINKVIIKNNIYFIYKFKEETFKHDLNGRKHIRG